MYIYILCTGAGDIILEGRAAAGEYLQFTITIHIDN